MDKPITRITSKNINDFANAFCKALYHKEKDVFIHPKDIGEEIGLTENQTKNLAHYIRRCALNKEYETYINFFIISNGSGYALLRNTSIEAQKKCFKKLYLNGKAIHTTISPLEKSLRENGVDIEALLQGFTDDGCEYDQEQIALFTDKFSKLNREGADFWN